MIIFFKSLNLQSTKWPVNVVLPIDPCRKLCLVLGEDKMGDVHIKISKSSIKSLVLEGKPVEFFKLLSFGRSLVDLYSKEGDLCTGKVFVLQLS